MTKPQIPEIGIFWVISGEIYIKSLPLDQGDNAGGIIDHPDSHYDYWEVLSKKVPECSGKDYDYFPRGRVLYNSREDTFILYADVCIRRNVDQVKLIAELMNLHIEKTKVMGDFHYQCSKCNKNYVV